MSARARHVLSLDPTNNLAAYLEGLAHECGGAHERALGGYLAGAGARSVGPRAR
ncbi:hypothetical protein [Nonomuraea roseola]|uniref:hypothetical protein n=1 Tax=Nonomuraea roseola TaxID=46179 RepID=UPI0031F8682E